MSLATLIAICILGATTASSVGKYPVHSHEGGGDVHRRYYFGHDRNNNKSQPRPSADFDPRDAEWLIVPGSLAATIPVLDIVEGPQIICPMYDQHLPWPVIGFDIRSEAHQGSADNSALNGITFYCYQGPSKNYFPITSLEGDWGSYSGQIQTCDSWPHNVELKTELTNPPDNAGGVNIAFVCGNGERKEGQGARSFGDWYKPGTECDEDDEAYICGFQTYVQKNQGKDKDDMGLVGLKIACCSGPSPAKVHGLPIM